MKVLLAAAPPGGGLAPVVPLGLLYVAAAAQRAGHEVRTLDLGHSRRPAADLAGAAGEFGPRVAGLSLRHAAETSALAPVYELYRGLVAALRPGPLVVLGGAGFSVLAPELLASLGADCGVIGEGEAALVEVLRRVEEADAGDGPPPSGLFRARAPLDLGGGLVRPLREEHWRAWGRYYALSGAPAPVQTGRGCGARCAYCSYPLIEGRSLRHRPPQDAADEMEAVFALPGVTWAFLVDAALNSDPAHATALAGNLERRRRGRIKPWQCCLSPAGLDADLAGALARANCAGCDLGADSLADEPLLGLDKGFDAEQARGAARALERAGIPYRLCLILGGPGEDAATLAETMGRAAELRPAAVQAFLGARLYPGTPLEATRPAAAGDGLMWPGPGAFYLAEAAREPLRALAAAPPRGWTLANAALVTEGAAL